MSDDTVKTPADALSVHIVKSAGASGTCADSGDGGSVPETPVPAAADAARPREFGGPKGPEPTRYGDWERKGRCVDF